MLTDVSGCVWQVISEFVEMCMCVHLNVYVTRVVCAWLCESGSVFKLFYEWEDFTDL